ncbi:hypothetical protein Lsan_0949 [Legionella santicrucis]|uniref:Uncharacterized protein n=1 Tax=Legionella santicrucis TaxID=45074 RepID=A0A0W0Z319_9GAMM|nr:hypothetical protein [Legionella santicrucis]KTD63516.1 hypothetical protein Lsan_0949 [Legionella santicrucis]
MFFKNESDNVKAKKNDISSVTVDWSRELESLPPQYVVQITYENGAVKQKYMSQEKIQNEYGEYLNKNIDAKSY